MQIGRKAKCKIRLNSFLARNVFTFLIVIAYAALLLFRINTNLWNDEIYTLKNFVLVPISKTITDYHVPNNHIFFNLVNNIYLKVIGVSSIDFLLEHPFVIRVLPFIYSILLLVFILLIGKKFFNAKVSLLALGIVATTIPFFNFTLQVRGYGLSMLLLVIAFYSYLSYRKDKRWLFAVLVALSVMLSVYTLPSNLYIIAGFLVFIFLDFLGIIIKFRRKNFVEIYRFSQVQIVLFVAITLGTLLAILLYIPVFRNVFFNRYVAGSGVVKFSYLLSFIFTMNYFLSARWFLLIFFLPGIIYLFLKRSELKSTEGHVVLLSISLIVIPFFIGFVRNTPAPDRIYVVLVPFWSFLMAIGISYFYKLMPLFQKYSTCINLALIALSVVTFYVENVKVKNAVADSIKGNYRMQDLYYNYYLWNYTPLNDVRQFKTHFYKESSVVLIEGAEPHDLPDYFQHFGMKFCDEEKFDSCLLNVCNDQGLDTFYVFSNHPYRFFEKLKNESLPYYPSFVKKPLSYHNAIQVVKTSLIENRVVDSLKSFMLTYGDSSRIIYDNINTTIIPKVPLGYSCQVRNGDDFSRVILDMESNSNKHVLLVQERIMQNDTLGNMLKFDFSQGNVAEVGPFILTYYLANRKNSNSKRVFFNDFEKKYDSWVEESACFDSNIVAGGQRSYKMDSSVRYSSTFRMKIGDLFPKDYSSFIFRTSVDYEFEGDTNPLLVFQVVRRGKNVRWEKKELVSSQMSVWSKKFMVNTLSDAKSTDEVRIYIWNVNGKNIWIDNFKVEVLNDVR
ncbi:MAG TPA: hypothetical protein PLA24_10700 [Tenuifilaceae bacterium]|nr:hypothetical protein [Tenuifilaceae bacterium]